MCAAQILPNQLAIKSQIHHGKCVCETCSCGMYYQYLGKHKCPEPIKKGQFHSSYNADYPKYEDFRPEGRYKMIQKNFILPDDKYQNQSSYTDDYNKRGIARPPQKFVPVGQLSLSKDPFLANTSYIQDYLNRGQSQRVQKVQLPKNFVLPDGRFDGGSNYMENFIGTKAQKQPQYRPLEQWKTGGNFQGFSSYSTDYQNKGVGIKAQKVQLPKNQVLPQGKFQGNTNYTTNFVHTKGQKNQQFKPQGQIKIGGNFQGSSSYFAHYNIKGAGHRAERYPLPQNQIMPDGKFEGNSSYAQNYVTNRILRQKPLKHQGQLKIGGDFTSGTSYLTDYVNKGIGLKTDRVPLPKNIVLPEGKFQGDSVYATNYIKSKTERRQQLKPQGQIKIGGNFLGRSSYLADYENRGIIPKTERTPLPKNHIMPLGNFQGNTSYTSDYTGSRIEKNPQFKPTGELKVGEAKFQGLSSYTNDYLNIEPPSRVQRIPLPKNQIIPQGKFETASSYTENYVPFQVKKVKNKNQIQEHCPCDQLSAPKYQVVNSEHVRWNAKTQKWQ